MFLKINMFKKLIKAAWKGIGLTVGNDGEEIYLVGNHWTIWLASWEMTNKAKAAIIELTGGLPSEGTAYKAWDGESPQYEMTELYDPEMYRPEVRNFKIGYKKTGVILNDMRKDYMVLQDINNFKCIMIDRNIADMVDFSSREKGEGAIRPVWTYLRNFGGLLVKRGMHFEGYGKSNRRRPKRYLYAGSDGDVGFLRRKKKEDK